MTVIVDMVQKFQDKRDELLKTFTETSSKVVGNQKIFFFKSKEDKSTAIMTLTYGEERIINRPSINDISVQVFN